MIDVMYTSWTPFMNTFKDDSNINVKEKAQLYSQCYRLFFDPKVTLDLINISRTDELINS